MSNTISIKQLIAGKFSTSSTYSVGDLVFYFDKLYLCNTAVTTPGIFDSSKWEQTTIADVLIAAKSRLNDTN